MVEKGPGLLPDEVRNVLKVAACDLHLKRWDRMNIASDIIDGLIETKWDTHLVGTRSGVLFRAQIDCEDGTDYKVNFLLSEEDLKRGADLIRQMEEGRGGTWGESPSRFPVPELYKFYDLRAAAGRTLH